MNTSEINALIGLPWKRGGRDPEKGFDCWGFFKWFYQEKLGIIIKENYNILPGETGKIVSAFSTATGELGNWVKLNDPKEFCAVALSQNKKIHHVGIWVKNGCLHATENVGVVFNDLRTLNRMGYKKVDFYRCKALL